MMIFKLLAINFSSWQTILYVLEDSTVQPGVLNQLFPNAMIKVTCLLMISFILAFTNVRADKITITDSFYVKYSITDTFHVRPIYVTPVTLSAKITNLMDFPELVVVALPEDATMRDNIIGNNSGIYKDGLATSIMVGKKMVYYVVKKEYLEKVGLNNIDWQKDANVQRLNVVNNWPARALTLSEKYTAITVEFKMVKRNNTYYVYKSKIVAKRWVKRTQQAIADEVKTFTDNVVDPLAPIYVSEEWMF
jgi:hypothetical protein